MAMSLTKDVASAASAVASATPSASSLVATAAQGILRGSKCSARLGNPPCRLHVFVLSLDTTSQTLRAAFERYGRVLHANVSYDHSTGQSKRYGFITYASLQEAAAGIQGMDDQFLDGLVVFASYATPKRPRWPQATI